MIGNDVIDLKLAAVQSNWRRSGFREKLFTQEENSLIDLAENPFQKVWRLWSMKESSYKAYQRLGPKRFFNPKKLECFIDDNESGRVVIGGNSFHTKTNSASDIIYTTAALGSEEQLIGESFIILSEEDESTACHRRLRQYCASLWSMASEELRIEKTAQGIPDLSYRSNKKAISISHHGRFGAFVIQA